MKSLRIFLLSLAFVIFPGLQWNSAPLAAQARLHPLFSDHMVLQCEKPVRIYGHASPGEAVLIRLVHSPGTGQQTRTELGTQADTSGRWGVSLRPHAAGGPYDLFVDASNSLHLTDIWFGEVWICSGQSNMEWSVSRSGNAEIEIPQANFPKIRLFKVPRQAKDVPQQEVQAKWQVCNPDTVKSFSAVGYYFGRELQKDLLRPIGLIQAAWGGTPAESWTTSEYLAADSAFKPILERKPRNAAWTPAALYNGMIAPLVGFGIRGAIWYQGESNATRAYQYRNLFPTMIRSWRESFGQGDFPFLFVQLANFKKRQDAPGASDWAELREAQDFALKLPNTGKAVIIDIGEANDIHPRNKQDVGTRLSLAARHVAYGQDLVHSGPEFHSMQMVDSKLVLYFRHTGSGLTTSDGEMPRGFAVAGEDRIFHWASANLEGDAIVLECPSVPQPLAVRYAWANNPDCNLYNKEGLPAAPFRTDDWPGITVGKR